MTPPRSIIPSLLGMFLLFIFGAVVTCAVFFVFIPGPDRGMTFYFALSLLVAVEFVFFIHLANPGLERAGAKVSSPATRYMVIGAIFIWFILTLIVAALAVSPARADTMAADKILIVDLIITFLLFAFIYFMYTKDLEVGQIDQKLVSERRAIQSDIPALEKMMKFAVDLGGQFPEHAVLSDRIGKKVDTVRTALTGISTMEHTPAEEKDKLEWQLKIHDEITQLVNLAGRPGQSSGQALETLNEIGKQTEKILVTLQGRDRFLMP